MLRKKRKIHKRHFINQIKDANIINSLILTPTKDSRFMEKRYALVNSIGIIARFIIIRKAFLKLLFNSGQSIAKIRSII